MLGAIMGGVKALTGAAGSGGAGGLMGGAPMSSGSDMESNNDTESGNVNVGGLTIGKTKGIDLSDPVTALTIGGVVIFTGLVVARVLSD